MAANSSLEDSFEVAQILLVGAPHGADEQQRGHAREAPRLATVAKRHPGPTVLGVLPRVGGLHRERALGGRHHEPLARLELLHLVDVVELLPEELRCEDDPRADSERLRLVPGDLFDVLVPGHGVVGVRGVVRDVAPRTLDLDLRAHIDHASILAPVSSRLDTGPRSLDSQSKSRSGRWLATRAHATAARRGPR